MPYNLQFLLNISGFHMEGAAYLGFLWISPDVADSVEWSRHKRVFSTSSKDGFCVTVHRSSAYRRLPTLG